MTDNQHNRQNPSSEPSERLDSVPDFEQESHGTDPHTQRQLDTMDDEAFDHKPPAVSDDDVEGIDDAKPAREFNENLATDAQQQRRGLEGEENHDGSSSEYSVIRESTDGVPDMIQEQGSDEYLVVPDEISNGLSADMYYYRLTAVMPAEINAKLKEIIDQFDLGDNLFGLQFQSLFQFEDLNRVIETINAWAGEWLPLSTGLVNVQSEVWGENQYITGWRLSNEVDLHKAQNELTTKLNTMAFPIEGASVAFRPYFMFLEHTPADIFPPLVAELQKSFAAVEFQIEQVRLVRKPMPNYEKRVAVEERDWKVYRTFPTV